MIMRKNKKTNNSSAFPFARATCILYLFGMLFVSIPLFYLTFEITAKEMLTVYERKVYALALEHILAGFTLLTGGCYLVERVSRASMKKE